MITTVEIDKAGRIVVPKKLRDALHLTPGTHLTVERMGDRLVFEQSFPEPQLVMKDGMWVLSGATRLAPQDANAAIDELREQRMHFVAGLSEEP